MNMGKTKVMKCKLRSGQVEDSGKYPCGVCHKGVGRNSILCVLCKKWIHKKCSGIVGCLQVNESYSCPMCTQGGLVQELECNELLLGNDGKLECVRNFCYLDDMLGDGGGCEVAFRARVRCAWNKFREFAPFLISRGASLKLKGKIYRCCVQSVMVYGSETWATKVADVQRLERNEMMMVRWICGVSLKDRMSNQELLDRLGIVCIA